MDSPHESIKNPYVGPRPFESSDASLFFGRERELAELRDWLIARRVALLFSPSGAGKTSLLQAGLIPALENEGYTVLPRVRVGIEPPNPAGGGAEAGQQAANRYLLSTIISLEENLPQECRAEAATLTGKSLADYLAERREKTASFYQGEMDIGQVLIVDQFEEVLSLDPTDLETKEAFFASLAPVLRDPQYFVLFAMREDYVASLEPYLRWFPERLATRYRIDLLSEAAALLAIRKPAQQATPPVEFNREAADELLNDLRQVRLLQADGTPKVLPGPYVEPIMLQVVCQRLWDSRSSPSQISLEDLRLLRSADVGAIADRPSGDRGVGATGDRPPPGDHGVGAIGDRPDIQATLSNVDLALGAYYARRVEDVASQYQTPKRNIRDWFDTQLITPQGLRSTIMKGAQESGGLENTVIQAFVDAYLVRGEQRRGLTWYELIHDRFIEPIRRNNSAWFKSSLALLQRQALLWEREGRPDSLLLNERNLPEAETWAKEHRSEMKESEAMLLLASQNETKKKRAATRRLRIFLAVAVGLAILAGLFALAASTFYYRANTSEKTAQANAHAAEMNATIANAALAASVKDRSTATAALAMSVKDRSTATAALATSEANRGTATAALATSVFGQATREAAQATSNAAQAESLQSQGLAEQASSGQLARISLSLINEQPEQAALWAVEAYCAADTLEARDALLTSLQVGAAQSIKPIENPFKASSGVRSVALSPDGRRMAYSTDQGVMLWDRTAQQRLDDPSLTLHTNRVDAVTFSPDGKELASAGEDKRIVVRDVSNPDEPWIIKADGPVFSLAYSPDGERLAAGVGSGVWIFDMARVRASGKDAEIAFDQVGERVDFLKDWIYTLAWSPDPKNDLLAIGDANGTLRVRDIKNGINRLDEAKAHGNVVFSVAWSPDGRLLASAGSDDKIQLWDEKSMTRLGEPLVGHRGDVRSISINSDGTLLASGSTDGQLIVWSLASRKPAAPPSNYFQKNWVSSVAFDPVRGSNLLLAGSQSAQARLFNVTPDEPFYKKIADDPGRGGRMISLWADGKGGVVGVQSYPPVEPPVYGPYLQPSNLLQLAPNARVWQPVKPQPGLGMATSAAFSLDGNLLVYGQQGSPEATILNWQIPRTIDTLNFHEKFPDIDYLQSLLSLAFSPNMDVLAAGICNYDKNMYEGICQTESNHILAASRDGSYAEEKQTHSAYITSLVYDPQGGFLASGSNDQTIQVWKLENGILVDPPKVIPGVGGVASLAWAQDGTILAAGYDSQTLQLFGVEAGNIKPLGGLLYGPPGVASSLAFDPAGVLYSSNVGSGLYTWVADPSGWAQRICDNAKQPLTEAEWRNFIGGTGEFVPACQRLETCRK
jgi:WD40 repeat protein